MVQKRRGGVQPIAVGEAWLRFPPYMPLNSVPTLALVLQLFTWEWAWLEVLSALVMH
jgi:hypothetical protein